MNGQKQGGQEQRGGIRETQEQWTWEEGACLSRDNKRVMPVEIPGGSDSDVTGTRDSAFQG